MHADAYIYVAYIYTDMSTYTHMHITVYIYIYMNAGYCSDMANSHFQVIRLGCHR